MASHEEPAGPRLEPPPVMVDPESGSSYAGSASSAPATPSCPYRDSQFHDQECSRYFDCPTHILRRDGTGAAGPDDPSGGTEGTPPTWQPEVAGIQTEASQGPPSQERDDDSTAGSSVPLPGHEGAGSFSSQLRPSSQQRATGTGAMTLMEALHDTRTPSSPAQTVDTEVALAQISSPRQPSSASLRGLRPTSSRSSLSANAPEFFSPQHQAQGQPAQPLRRPSQPRAAPEFALPRWQPDAEVTFCPICRTQFSIFVRKHHCRKCGRVVCASCSPHRITIPYQYIVRAPGEALGIPLLRGIWGEELEADGVDVSQLGGGERVRLCNPCVPDPNTTPPQALNSPGISQFAGRSPHQRSQSSNSMASNLHAEGMPSMPANYRPFYAPAAWNEANARTRSVTMNADNHPRPRAGFGNASSRILAGTPPVYYSRGAAFEFAPSHRHGSFATRYPHSGQRNGSSEASSSNQAQFLRYGHDAAAASSSSSAAAINNRPLPAPPQIPEEDECPVCHRELPSRDLPNFEAVREAHVNSCIAAHSTYTPAPTAPGQPGAQGSPPPRAVRRTGMFPYLATEKDCVDSAECTICLEEFEAGVPMARLECLCRFHHACISAWFINHPGRCPVHQHDSLGY